jgi:hypothetical protein
MSARDLFPVRIPNDIPREIADGWEDLLGQLDEVLANEANMNDPAHQAPAAAAGRLCEVLILHVSLLPIGIYAAIQPPARHLDRHFFRHDGRFMEVGHWLGTGRACAFGLPAVCDPGDPAMADYARRLRDFHAMVAGDLDALSRYRNMAAHGVARNPSAFKTARILARVLSRLGEIFPAPAATAVIADPRLAAAGSAAAKPAMPQVWSRLFKDHYDRYLREREGIFIFPLLSPPPTAFIAPTCFRKATKLAPGKALLVEAYRKCGATTLVQNVSRLDLQDHVSQFLSFYCEPDGPTCSAQSFTRWLMRQLWTLAGRGTLNETDKVDLGQFEALVNELIALKRTVLIAIDNLHYALANPYGEKQSLPEVIYRMRKKKNTPFSFLFTAPPGNRHKIRADSAVELQENDISDFSFRFSPPTLGRLRQDLGLEDHVKKEMVRLVANLANAQKPLSCREISAGLSAVDGPVSTLRVRAIARELGSILHVEKRDGELRVRLLDGLPSLFPGEPVEAEIVAGWQKGIESSRQGAPAGAGDGGRQ